MNRTLLQTVVRHAEALAAAPSHASDADLLGRFTTSNDDAAFAELVRRHGPMVWAVCRHTLSDAADADDAFQATFLALIRSAGRIRSGAAVGGWLHGVAVRVCTKVRRGEVRRRQREQKAACPEADRPVPDSTWDGLLAAVHEEVQKLPDAERAAFVLCDLEGVRQPDAAGRLGWKLGTLSGRLTRARQRLLERLTSRGLAPALAAGGLGIGATANATVPDSLVDRVVVLTRSGDTVSPVILKLVTGVMPMSRTKLLAAAVFVAGGLAAGFGDTLLGTADAQTKDVVDEVKKLTGSADGGGQPSAGGVAQPGSSSGGGPRGGLPPAGGQGSGPRGNSGSSPPPGMGAPGAPGMSMGGAPGGMGGGMSMPAPARTQWEYLFADRPGSADDFKKALTGKGNEGWEYCGSGPGEMLVFKRPKNAPTGGGMMIGMSGIGMGGPPMAGGGGGFGGLGGSMPPGSGAAAGMPGMGGGPGMSGPGGPGAPAAGGGRPLGMLLGGAMPPAGAPPKKLELTTLTLERANAADVSALLSTMIDDRDAKLNVVPGANAILLHASADTTEFAKKVVEAVEKATAAKKPVK